MFLSQTGTDLRDTHSFLRGITHVLFDQPSKSTQGRKRMNVTRVVGLAAVGALLILAAPAQRAQAMSLASPGPAAAIQADSTQTTEVRWGHGHHGHHGYHRHYGHHWGHHRHYRHW
jgi:hypothetical protein